MSIGVKGAVAAAAIMAATGYELLTDAELRAAARTDFGKRKGSIEYLSAVSSGQKGPPSGQDEEVKTGIDEMVLQA